MPVKTNAPTGVKYILEGKYPTFIKEHNIFKRMNKISKVFPHIGLPNIKEDVAWSGDAVLQMGRELVLYSIRDTLGGAVYNTKAGAELHQITVALYNDCYTYHSSMVKDEEGKIVIKLERDIVFASKIHFKKGESLFKVYGKLAEQWAAVAVPLSPLDQMPAFKAFSSANLPNKKYSIVFSSTGEVGAWDIATMSMRGISSCQSWTSANSRGLIGSISSQFVGVIYLTDDNDKFNEYGSRMYRRAVVRYGIHNTTKKPALLMDRVYPAANVDLTAINLFKEFLTKKSGLPIIVPSDPLWGQYYMPQSYVYNKIPLGAGEYTYMDNQIKKKAEFTSQIVHNWTGASVLQNIRKGIHQNLQQQFQSYLSDKKTSKRLFKGGIANLMLYLQKKGNIEYGAHFIPTMSFLGEIGVSEPLPAKFISQIEYEKAYIKAILANSIKIKTYHQSWMRRGPWYKDFPRSSEKFFDHLWNEYKQQLIKAYKVRCATT